jgi:hypothetical protein
MSVKLSSAICATRRTRRQVFARLPSGNKPLKVGCGKRCWYGWVRTPFSACGAGLVPFSLMPLAGRVLLLVIAPAQTKPRQTTHAEAAAEQHVPRTRSRGSFNMLAQFRRRVLGWTRNGLLNGVMQACGTFTHLTKPGCIVSIPALEEPVTAGRSFRESRHQQTVARVGQSLRRAVGAVRTMRSCLTISVLLTLPETGSVAAVWYSLR